MDAKHESKVEKTPYVETALVSGKENLNTYLQLMEDATKAMFGWQHEVLKFADMRVAANMKLASDVAEAKDAGDFAKDSDRARLEPVRAHLEYGRDVLAARSGHSPRG